MSNSITISIGPDCACIYDGGRCIKIIDEKGGMVFLSLNNFLKIAAAMEKLK